MTCHGLLDALVAEFFLFAGPGVTFVRAGFALVTAGEESSVGCACTTHVTAKHANNNTCMGREIFIMLSVVAEFANFVSSYYSDHCADQLQEYQEAGHN